MINKLQKFIKNLKLIAHAS